MRDISTLKLNFFGLGAIGLFLFAIFKLKSEGHKIEILEIIKGYYEFTIPYFCSNKVYRVTVNYGFS